jgi:hypothetical protein
VIPFFCIALWVIKISEQSFSLDLEQWIHVDMDGLGSSSCPIKSILISNFTIDFQHLQVDFQPLLDNSIFAIPPGVVEEKRLFAGMLMEHYLEFVAT